MTDVGVGYVELVPTTKGFSSKATKTLTQGLEAPSRAAGQKAGDAMSTGINDGVERGSGKFKAAGLTLAAGLTQGLEAERIEDKFVASLGGGEWAEEMGDVAANLYGDAFGSTLEDSTKAVQEVLRAGLIPEDEWSADAIEALTAQTMTFADVLDQDLNMSLQAVDRMLSTGIVSSAEEAFDVLTTGIQNGADQSGDLVETFQEYSGAFREIGLSASDATGLMTRGLQNGARDADKVADAMKEFGIRAQDGSTAAAAGFEAIGLNAEKMTAAVAGGGPAARDALDQVLKGLTSMEDPVARNAAAVALFGTQAEDLGDALFALDLDAAGRHMGDTAGATDQLASAYDNAATRIESFKRKGMQKLVEFIGGQVIPTVERLIDFLGPSIGRAVAGLSSVADNVSMFWNALTSGFTEDEGTPIEMFALGIRDAFMAAQPILEAFTGSWSTFGELLGQHGDLARSILIGIAVAIGSFLVPALVGLVAPLIAAAAPFVLLGLAAAGIAAGLIWAYNNVEQFRALVETALPQIGELFSAGMGLAAAAIDTAVALASWVWSNFGDLLIDTATVAMNLIGGLISGGLDIIVGTFRLVTAILRGDWSAAWAALGQIVGGAWTIIKSIFRAGLDSIVLIAKVGLRLLKMGFVTILSEVKQFAKARLDDVVNFFRRLPGRIRSAVSTLARAISSPFKTAFDAVKSLWNRTAGGFSFSIPDWVPKVGGKGFSIPKMHTGGIFNAPPGSSEGLALLKQGETVRTTGQEAALARAVTPTATTGGGFRLDPSGRDLFLDWIRATIRDESGGDVQVALGTS